jgi:curli biogenesis system outer membrane secretion channel CsgG
VKNIKKAAIISAMVLMISIIPAFALNDTNTTNGTQDQTSNTTGTQNQNTSGTADQNCQKNCNGNCDTCDEEQHKYQYGQKNDNACVNNGTCNGEQHKYQNGQNGNAGTNNCNNLNCLKK